MGAAIIKYFFVLMLSLKAVTSKAQHVFGNYAADKIPASQFYFVGQSHNNKANNIIEKEMLFALNNKYKVRYNILEYAHSAAFLVNQYLQSGNDSLLLFIEPEANFTFIKAIKAYNDSIGNNRKISFYGLDFENRHQGKYTKKAIAIILQQAKLPANETLSSLLQNITTALAGDVKVNLEKLKNYLFKNEDKCRLLLQNYFIDVLLISNAQYNFSPNRDESMINNFKLLYNELSKIDKQPAFFASFGTGHVNTNNNKGIAMQLMQNENSPVKNKVCIIGIQYFNCQFNKNEPSKPAEGNLNFLCSKSAVKLIASKENNQGESIAFLTKENIDAIDCNKNIKKFSALFIVSNFSATKFWTWE